MKREQQQNERKKVLFFITVFFCAFSCIECLDIMPKMFNNVYAFTQYLYTIRVVSTQHNKPKKKHQMRTDWVNVQCLLEAGTEQRKVVCSFNPRENVLGEKVKIVETELYNINIIFFFRSRGMIMFMLALRAYKI